MTPYTGEPRTPEPPAAEPPAPEPRTPLTYRASHERHAWLRAVAYGQRRSIQSIIDEAVDLHRAEQARLAGHEQAIETARQALDRHAHGQAEPLIIDDPARSRTEQQQAGGPA